MVGALVVVISAMMLLAGRPNGLAGLRLDLPWTEPREVVRGCEGDDIGSADPDEMYSFVSLDDWVTHAEVIARVTVTDARPAPVHDDGLRAGETAEAPRHLVLRIDHTYTGEVEAGQIFAMTSTEPYLVHADGERRVAAGTDCFTLVAGDEAIVALVGDGEDASNSGLMTHDSAFLIDGQHITRTRRQGPGVEPFEGRPVDELDGAIVDALR